MEEVQTTVEPTVENKGQEDAELLKQQQAEALEAKKNESEYQQQLDEFKAREEALEAEKRELEAKLEKEKDIVDKKNRALESEKKKNATSGEELKKELLVEVEKRFVENELDRRLKSFTNDPTEREVIKKHYQSSIVKSGNLDNDFRLAVAVANSGVVWEQRAAKAREENNENYLTTFQSASAVKGQESNAYKNEIQRQAEELVRSVNPEAVKQISKYFKK